MADIFLVRATADAGVDRYMVLKRVLAARARDAVFSQLFLDEARLAAQLQHPNIAQVYDVGKLGGSYFYSMEYVHGEDLRVLLKHCAGKKQLIPINLVVYIATNALAALHHAHERTTSEGKPLGIVHRDISPSNIMVSYEGSIKLIDFGVAKAAQRSTTTNAGSVKGKYGYMSPEQVRGHNVDRRSDVFSLGIVLHELLTGRRLFKRDTDYAAMSAVIEDDAPAPSKLRSDVPEELDRVVATALERDPDKRYPTAEAMLEDLESVAAAERFLLSASAMRRFIREQFGAKPEPWHVLRDQVGEQLEIASEAIAPDHNTMTDVPIEVGADDVIDQLAEAPLLKPQEDAAAQTPIPGRTNTETPTPTPTGFAPTPSSESSPSQASFTPNPSGSSFTPAPSTGEVAAARKRRMFVIVGTAVAACLIGVVVLSGAFGSKATSEANAQVAQGSNQDTTSATMTPPTTPTAPTATAPTPTPTPADKPAAATTTLDVAITGAPDAVVRVDGREAGRGAAVQLELAPGPHDIVVEAPGRPPVEKHVELVAGRATVLEIVVPAAAQKPRKPQVKPQRDPCSDRAYVKANPLKCQ